MNNLEARMDETVRNNHQGQGVSRILPVDPSSPTASVTNAPILLPPKQYSIISYL